MRMVQRLLLCLVLTLLFSVSAQAGLGVQVDYNHFETPEGDLSFLEGGDFGLGVRSDFGTRRTPRPSSAWPGRG